MRIIQHLRAVIATAMTAVESAAAPTWTWIAAFFGIVFLRNILELLSGSAPIYSPVQFFLHYPLAYAGPFLALGLVLSAGSGEPIGRVGRLLVVAWSLTLLPPLLRLPGEAGFENVIFYGIPVDRLGYSMPMEGPDYLERLLFFFSPFHRFSGTTWGIRMETLIASVLAIVYVRIKGRGLWRALATGLGVYLTALVFFHLPMLFFSIATTLFPGTGFPEFFWGEGILARGPIAERHVPLNLFYLTLLCVLLAAAWGLRWNRAAWVETARRRPGHLAVVVLFAGIAGILFGLFQIDPAAAGRSPVPYDGFALLAMLLGLIAAAVALPGNAAAGVGAAGQAGTRAMNGGWTLTLSAAAVLMALVGGTASATVMLALLGCRFLFSAAPFVPAGWPGVHAIGITLTAFLATLAGYALLLGPEAVPLFPREFVLAAALAWFPAFLAADFTGLNGTLRWAGFLLAAVCPVTLTMVLGLPAPWWVGAAVAGLLLGAALWLPRPLSRSIPTTAPLFFTVLIMVLGGDRVFPAMRAGTLRSARFHARQAQGLETAGQLEKALEERRRVVELAPADPLAHYNLGVVLARTGRQAEAAAAFEHSGRLDPDFAEAFENLGHVRAALGRQEEAKQAFLQAIRAWEVRLESGSLPAVGRRRAAQKILDLRSLLAAGLPEPDHSR